ncbi:2-hydroxy-3-oxopropionate reductase [Venustampulla echinocandica]|uniref:2-hydroxy-3-oxopropionate reductase n=1 Tax=Venustampulla echinocandica TaxID=2656787 RepID=A0A370U0J9_9HELO|nr:2-hydroxy-3-oxopropionate reductase [Venustampulla echinocandica]RDL41283.1 2-hydroxy-3-oxopropionate reductase [Venustampulla echinocandica]
MGFGMATNLVKRSLVVTGFDVYPPTLTRFVAEGGSSAPTPRETVQGAKHVVFMVATAAQILSALFDEETGAIHTLVPDATLILCSTGPPEYTPNVRKLLDEKYARKDVKVVDAPVSGGTIRAADGTLTILASGPEDALAAARPILDVMAGSNLYIIPGGLGAGTKVKMVHQVLAGIHLLMASEAMGFAAALGLDTKKVFELVKASEGTSWMFENRTPHMLVDDKRIYSALNIIVKDIAIVTAGGRSAEFPLFLASTTEQVLASGVSAGYGLEDDAKLVKVYLPQNPSLVLTQASSAASSEIDAAKLKLIVQMMSAVHLVSTMEAMSLGAKVGLDAQQLFEIISTAAGTSWMFKDRAPQLLSGNWTSKKTVDDVIAELTESIEAANLLKYPLHLSGTAFQLLQLASLKGLGKQPDVAVSKLWEGPEGRLFRSKA